MPVHKQGKKNRKHGRQKDSSANKAYKAENRQLKNKIKRMKKTLKYYPNNTELRQKLKEYE